MVEDVGVGVKGLGCRVWGVGSGLQGLRRSVGVKNLGCRVAGVGFSEERVTFDAADVDVLRGRVVPRAAHSAGVPRSSELHTP